jgi:hypothetical protein
MEGTAVNMLVLPAATGGLTDVLVGIDPDKRFVLLLVLVGLAFGLVLGVAGIVSGTINSLHRRRSELDLKREMIERGMSADEIEKIIEAAAPPEDATERWIASWAKSKGKKCPPVRT